MSVSIFEPRTMGKIISRMPPVRTFFKTTFFNKVHTFPTKSVDVDIKKGNRQVAPIVSRRSNGKVIPNSGYITKTYTPPNVAPEKVTTVEDVEGRMAGESITSGMSPAERAVLKLSTDLVELDNMIVRREELMCVQAIFTGKIPLIGDGVNEEIDFGFTNSETISTAAKKWSATTSADPIADLKNWRRTVQKNGFVNCNICVMSSTVTPNFLANEKVMKQLDIKSYDLAAIKPRELPNGVTYIGTINELGMDIYEYNEWYLDDWTDPENPTEKPLVPDDYIALMSTAAEYSIAYGCITIVNDKTQQFESYEDTRVPESFIGSDRRSRILRLNSCPLPIPHEVDSWYVAKVQ